MNFLNRAKNQATKIVGETADTAVETPKTVVPKAPGARPGIPAKPAVPGARPGIPSAPKVPGARPSIPAKPAVNPSPVKEEVVAPVVEEKKGPMAQKSNPFKLGAKPAAEAVAEVTKVDTPKVTAKKEVVDTVVEEVVPEAITSITEEAIVNEPVVEKPAETKKKTNSRRKAATKKEEPKEDISTEEPVEIVIPTTDMTYAEAVSSIKSTFHDEEWDNFKQDTSERLNEIHLTGDMTPTALKQTIADLTSLRDSVWVHFISSKTLYENLTEKDKGVLDVTSRLNAKGSNEAERKLSGAVALMNYKEPDSGKNINLYEVLYASRDRYNYSKGLIESIAYKHNSVITMLGNLKLEK